MPIYRAPGVYIEEVPALPPAVTEVETAIPAFIGHTEIAQWAEADELRGRPTRIDSMAAYERCFGRPAAETIEVALTTAGDGFTAAVTPPAATYLLHHAVRQFFDNGGAACFVVSVAGYTEPAAVDLAALTAGLDAVALDEGPTLLVIPEAVRLEAAGYAALVQAMLLQCGTRKDRFAILDLPGGDAALDDATLSAHRAAFGSAHLSYGAAYYPFVRARVPVAVRDDQSNVSISLDGAAAVALGALRTTNSAACAAAHAALGDVGVALPPSGAVAGVYARIDATRGVWKAPANVRVDHVVEPCVRLGDAFQEALNIDRATGKSINPIRAFAGKGTLVWGARTLAGNDNEWRYVPVRRFVTLVETSVRNSSGWVVFEPNDAATWVRLRAMVENYLMLKWRAGALVGATPRDAFFVRCGLGTTMNAQDVAEGRMTVEIGLAVVRPAEFIVLRISQRLQPN
jgi:phage tail sheath protein FI